MVKVFLFFILIATNLFCYTQSDHKDLDESNDTLLLSLYNKKVSEYKEKGNKDSVIFYLQKSYEYLKKNERKSNDFRQKINLKLQALAKSYYSNQNYDSAMVYFDKCIDLSKDLNDFEVLNDVFYIQVYLHTSKGDNSKAMDLSQEVLDIGFKFSDTMLIAKSKYAMTFVYDAMKDFEAAIDVSNDLLDNYLSFLPSKYEGVLLSGQSYFYYENKDFYNAVKFGLKSVSVTPEKASSHFNLGDAFLAAYKDSSIVKRDIIPLVFEFEKGSAKLSEEEAKEELLILIKKSYLKSISILNENGNTKNLIHPYNGLGDYYRLIGNSRKVVYYYEMSWEIIESDKTTLLKDYLRISKRLYIANKDQKNNEKALYWLELTDSLEKEQLKQNNLKELGEKQAKFEYSQKLYADSLAQKERDIKVKFEQDEQQLKLETEQLKKYYLYGGLLLLITFLFVLYRRFQLAIKQNKVIELQKESIEEKRLQLRKTHEDVQDSINYSRRIQKAIFPSDELLKELYPDSFIFFKPKDVVSGDFYWYTEVNGKRVFVTADCTGHGVPGAFMTIIGINIIKEIIQEGILKTDEILLEINARLIERLSQHNKASVKDGMDLSLCVIDNSMIEFSGAHLPLYHVSDGVLSEYKGNNLFLGSKVSQNIPKVHYVPYKKGDFIFMATDGLPDQKGGESGKKFYAKRMRQFLLGNINLPMSEQHSELEGLRKDWLGNSYEQLDDMTIVGIKL